MFKNFDKTTKQVEGFLNDTSLMDGYDEEKVWNDAAKASEEFIHSACNQYGISLHKLVLVGLLVSIVVFFTLMG